MKTKGYIIIKDATKEKADFVETNRDVILKATEGTSTILGRTIKRIKNTFIIF